MQFIELYTESKKHTPIIPALLEAEWADHEVRSSRAASTTWQNPISIKNTKLSWA